MIKLSFFLRELNDLYEHYGDIGVDCKDFQVEVTQYPDKDETYLITFSPAKEMELARCQRYYEKSYDLSVVAGASGANGYFACAVPSNTIAANQYYNSAPYKVTKRTSPTVTIYGLGGTAGTVSNASGTDLAANSGLGVNGGEAMCPVYNGSGGSVTTTATSVLFHWLASAEF